MYTKIYELKKCSVCMAGITDQLRELELCPSDCGTGRKISADAGLGYEITKCYVRTLE